MSEEDLDPDLVGHHQVEVRCLRCEVAHQLRLGGYVGCDQRNGPGPLVHSTAPFGGQRLARRNRFVRAVAALHQRPHLRIGDARLVAKGGRDVFAEVVVAFAVGGQIAP